MDEGKPMRKRIYKREKFIESPYRMVMRYGFENLSAKRLATYMQISTQPIYNQFNNFQEVKDEVVYRLFHESITSTKKCREEHHPLVCFPVKIIKYYLINPQKYYLSWQDTSGNPKLMYQLYENFFLKYLLVGRCFYENDEDAKKVIFSKLMISILGIIEKSQMDEDLTEEEIEAVWLDMVKKYIENE